MYSDTLFALERAHLLQVMIWGGASMLAGAVVLAILAIRRVHSVLLSNFAIQCMAWGLMVVALAGMRLRGLSYRDATAAATLDRLLWANAGFDAACIILGITLALTGWLLGRRLGLIGAGIGIIVQGLALFTFDLRFVLALSPYV